jgi:hypothetical protein
MIFWKMKKWSTNNLGGQQFSTFGDSGKRGYYGPTSKERRET